MDSYDEDLNQNSFFTTLKECHTDLFDQCVSERWLICVPRQDSLPQYEFTDEDYFDHILKPIENVEIKHASRRASRSEASDFVYNSQTAELEGTNGTLIPNGKSQCDWTHKTLSHVNAEYRVNQYVKLDEAVLQRSNNQRLNNNKSTTVNVLFEETFYTEDKKKYKVLCTEYPLYSRILTEQNGNVEDIWSVNSLQDCIDFLWIKGKLRVLESYDAYIKLFLHNHRTMELPIAIQRDLVNTLYLKCLNFALTENPMEGANSHYILRVATETYILNGIYRFLMGALTSTFAQEDCLLNKIIRNLAEIHPQDLDIDKQHWDNLTRARQELGRLDIHTSPLAKLNCLKKTLRHMRPDPMIDSNGTSILTADELLPIWSYLIVKTPLANWSAQLQYLRTFRFSVENENDNESSFYIVTLEAALAHLKTGKVLGLAVGERDVGIACELGDVSISNGHSFSGGASDIQAAEMFLAVKSGNSFILEDLITQYEKERQEQNIEKHLIDQSLLCHPLCDCEKCTSLVTPAKPVLPRVGDLVTDDGMSLLHMACVYGRPKIVDFLINHGVPLDATDEQGTTPLHYAAGRGHQNALLLVLHAGANMEPLDKMSRTPLHLAAQNGHEGCVKALIYYAEHSRQSLNLSPRDFNGNTPLHDASRWGFQGIVQILVENGAAISITNNRMSTPVDCAHDIHVIRILQRSVRRRSWVQPNHGDFINIEVVPNEESDGVVMLISEPNGAIENDQNSNEEATSTRKDSVIKENNLLAPPNANLRTRRHSSINPPTFGLGSDTTNTPKFRRHSSILAPTASNGLQVLQEHVVHNPNQEPFIIDSSTTEEEVRRVSRDESRHVRKVSVESLDNIAVAILPELPAIMGVKRKRENQSRDAQKLFSAIVLGDVPLALFYLGIPATELESSENQKPVLELVPPCHPLCPCNRCIAKSAGLGLDINTRNLNGLTPLHMAIQHGLLSLVKVMYRFGADLKSRTGLENLSTVQIARSNGESAIVAFLQAHGVTE